MPRELIRLYVSVFVATLGAGLYVYFIPLYAQKLGGSFLDLGFIGTAYAVTYAVGPILAGYLADRVNRVGLYSLGIMLIAVVTITLVLARSVADVVILRSLAGIAFAFFWPTSEVLVADMTNEENRLKEMGYYSVAWASGYFIGPTLGGLVIQTYGYYWLFVASFTLIVFALLMSVIWAPPINTRRKRHNASLNSSPSLSIMKGLARWYVVLLCYGILSSVLIAIFPGYANIVGVTPAFIGVLFSAYSLARIVVYAIVGRLQRFSETKILLIVSAVFGAAFLVVGVFPNFSGFLLALVLMGCCSATMFPMLLNLISCSFRSERLGIAVGSYESVFGIGSAIGPLLAGFLAIFAGGRWTFALLSIFGAIMFLFAAAEKV